MHSIVLLKVGIFLDFAHVNENGGCAIEYSVSSAFIGLPSINEMINALLEELAIDLDVRHLFS